MAGFCSDNYIYSLWVPLMWGVEELHYNYIIICDLCTCMYLFKISPVVQLQSGGGTVSSIWKTYWPAMFKLDIVSILVMSSVLEPGSVSEFSISPPKLKPTCAGITSSSPTFQLIPSSR